MILEASVQYLRFPGDNDKEDTESNCLSQMPGSKNKTHE